MAVRLPPPEPTCCTEPPGPALQAAGIPPAGTSARERHADPLSRLVRALARQAAQEAMARPVPSTSSDLEELS